MPKDRLTATITIVAAIALVVMVVLMLTAPPAVPPVTPPPPTPTSAAAVEGEAFLANNATQEGVQTTASGLQYRVITEGTGERPTASDTVTVNYVGTLIDGTEFDSSESPITFALNGVIPGWTEGLQLMPVGSTYMFYIPSELAYGAQGRQPVIPPHSVLVFEVELVDIPSRATEETSSTPEATEEAPETEATPEVTAEATADS